MSDLNFYADQLSIETPEQVDLRFPIAGMGSRFLAVLVDSVLQVAGYVLLGLILYVTAAYRTIDRTMSNTSNTGQKWLLAGFILLNFLVFWGYFSFFEAYWKGQTPGKRLMKLRVLKDSGRSITLFEALARNLVRMVDMLPSLYLVGLITMLCNRENKRLGDFAAGTMVVHERTDEQPLLTHSSRTFTATAYAGQGFEATPFQSFMPQARASWAEHEAVLPADAVARLHAPDLHVIETFFSRALDLSVERRDELGTRVAARMGEKMRWVRPEGMTPERMLELIVHRMRSQGRR